MYRACGLQFIIIVCGAFKFFKKKSIELKNQKLRFKKD